MCVASGEANTVHRKFVKRIHTIYVAKVRDEGKTNAKRWLSQTLPNYEDFLLVREYTYSVLGLRGIQQGH